MERGGEDGGVLVMGHAGEPVCDIKRQTVSWVPYIVWPLAMSFTCSFVYMLKVSGGINVIIFLSVLSVHVCMYLYNVYCIMCVHIYGYTCYTYQCQEDGQTPRESIDVLADTLLWGHMCPTAPGK